MPKHVKTLTELAKQLDMEREHLSRRYASKPEAPGKTAKGYDVAAWMAFVNKDRKRQVRGDGSLRDEKTKREIEKLDIEIGKLRDQLKPIDEWANEVREIVNIVKVGLDHFVQRVAADKKDVSLFKWASACRDDVILKLNEKVSDAQEANG